MTEPQKVDNRIFKDAPPWTPEEPENFQRLVDEIRRVCERIDVEERVFQMKLHLLQERRRRRKKWLMKQMEQKLIGERKLKDGGQ